MTIKLEQVAPNFSIADAHGVMHTLKDYRGKWLVIYFYPKDNTPGCTKEACTLRDDYSLFSNLNTEIIGISTDNSKSHLKFTEKQSLSFPLLADIDHKVSLAYGTLFKLGPIKFCKRHSFIIDPNGKVAKIYRTVSLSLHSQELIQDLKILQKSFIQV